MNRLSGIKELREIWEKNAFVQVPPHPAHDPAAQQGAPPDPAMMQGQGMPPDPNAMPPDPNAMPPGQPPAGLSPEVAEILQGVTMKLDEVAQGTQQQFEVFRQELDELRQQQELKRVKDEERANFAQTLLAT